MICKNCGGELQEKDGKLVCAKCGAEFNENEKPESAEVIVAPRGFSSKKNIIIIILAGILVLGLGAGITEIAVTNSPSYKVSQSLTLAERYLSEQNYEQAIIEFENILEIEPMNVDAYLGLAKAYEKMGDIDKAIEVLREGLERTDDPSIQSKLDILLNPHISDNPDNSESGESEDSTPEYGSMRSVTIADIELDIATTYRLKIFNEEAYGNADMKSLMNDNPENHPQITYVIITKPLSVTDIEAIGMLKNLRTLDIIYADLSDVTTFKDSFANLTDLQYLDLSHNDIIDITSLANLINLTDLRLDDNQISDITPLMNLTNLTYLDLGDNQISNITPLTNLTNLTYLNLVDNQISDIRPLANLINLTSLFLTTNQISDVTSLSNLTKLKTLGLGGNQVTDTTPLTNLTNMTVLGLWGNQISESRTNR